MPDDIPGGGRTKIPKWVWIAGGGGLLVLGYIYYKNQQANAANANANPYGQPSAGNGLLEPIVINGGGGTGGGGGTTPNPTTTPTPTQHSGNTPTSQRYQWLSPAQSQNLLGRGYDLWYQENGRWVAWHPGISGPKLYYLQGSQPATFNWLSPVQSQAILRSGGQLWYQNAAGLWNMWQPGVTRTQNPSLRLYSKS